MRDGANSVYFLKMCRTSVCLGAVLLLATALMVSTAPPSSTRVVNGTDSTIEKYPFMISLRGATGSHSCGGSIIGLVFVLTAAHCTYGRVAENLSVQYGVTNIDAKGPNIVAVKRIIQHKEYDSYSIANDISLLEVEKPFPIDGKTVAAVALPPFDFETPQVPEGAPGVLAGWGLNATNGYIMRHLQEVNLKIYSDAECQERHGSRVLTTNICGGVDKGGKGQCSGDSGGPLLLNGKMQVGIVSWSVKPCTVAPYPGVYTKVAKYADWILRNMFILT